MPINSNILLGIQPYQAPDPINMLAKMAAIQNAQQEQQMNALKMQEFQRGVADQNALKDWLANGGMAREPIGALRHGAAGRQAYEAWVKGQKEQSDAAHSRAQTDKLNLETMLTKLDRAQKDLASTNSVADAAALTQHYVSIGFMSPADAARTIEGLPKTDAEFPVWRDNERMRMLTVSEQLKRTDPTIHWADLGGAIVPVQGNPNAPNVGRMLPNSSALPKTQTPDNAATTATSAANNAATISAANARNAATIASQEKIAQLNREATAANLAPSNVTIVDPANPDRMIAVDARRYAPGATVGDKGVLGVAGKEPAAALRQNAKAEGKAQLAEILDQLELAYQKLDAAGDMPSKDRSGMSNIAASITALPGGQAVARAWGTDAQANRDVISSARMQLMNAIKQATGMSAKQMDSNMELQTWLKSVSDPYQRYDAVQQILDNLRSRYVKDLPTPSRGSEGKIQQGTAPATRTVTRTGTSNGRKVIQYSDGSIEYAD